MTITEFQQRIRDIYFEKDSARGISEDFMWLVEEVGELSEALRSGTKAELEGEFADVAAWLATLASIAEVDLARAIEKKYGNGCPKCGNIPCTCEGR